MTGRSARLLAFAFGIATPLACSLPDVELTDPIASPSVWSSREDCEALLATRNPDTTTPRIATWNIRFFPDLVEGASAESSTDVAWLACAIASQDIKLMFVQEFKRTEKGLTKQAELIERLNQYTGGSWRLELFDCPPEEVQHSGFLFDETKVQGSDFRTLWELTPEQSCSNQVSPGFAGYFSFAGGPDFHAIVLHLHTGEAQASLDGRTYTISALAQLAGELSASDRDIVIGGDFNTSGCNECEPSVSSETEVTQIAAQVSSYDPPLELLPASQTCSREAGDGSKLLDHFIVSQSMQEVPSDAIAQVGGICEAIQCDRSWYLRIRAREMLSDHCPVTLDLTAFDDD